MEKSLLHLVLKFVKNKFLKSSKPGNLMENIIRSIVDIKIAGLVTMIKEIMLN